MSTYWAEQATGVWTHTKHTSKGLPLVTVVVRGKEGALIVYSPTRGLGDDVHEELLKHGTPTVLVAPNHYHHLGLSEYIERYPNAITVCSDIARPRLLKQAPNIDFLPLASMKTFLNAQTSLIEPPATKGGEIWLMMHHGDDRLWIVGDAWFNLPEHPSGIFGVLCRILGVSRGLRVGRTWFWFQVRDPRAYRSWVTSTLSSNPPTRLVCLHGDALAGPELADRLRKVLNN